MDGGQPEINLNTVMARRFELVDKISQLDNQHKAVVAPLSDELTLCEQFIKSHMIKEGMQQAKTPAGQAHFVDKTKASVTDRDAFIKGVVAENLWTLVTNAVSKDAVKEYVGVNSRLPPGVKLDVFKDLNWKRA